MLLHRLLPRLGALVLSAALLTSAAVAVHPAAARATGECDAGNGIGFEVNAGAPDCAFMQDLPKMYRVYLAGDYAVEQAGLLTERLVVAIRWMHMTQLSPTAKGWPGAATDAFAPVAAVSEPATPKFVRATPATGEGADLIRLIGANLADAIGYLVAANHAGDGAEALRDAAVDCLRIAALALEELAT
jgi:hypothetical protein